MADTGDWNGTAMTRVRWRRRAVLAAATVLCTVGLEALGGTAAHAYTDTNGADFEVNAATLASVLAHGVSFTCDPVQTQPSTTVYSNGGTTSSTTQQINPCAMKVKLAVSPWTAHYLKLASTTLVSAVPKMAPVSTTTRSTDGTGSTDTVDQYAYNIALPARLVHTLKTKVIDGFHIDGLAVILSGTASYTGFLAPNPDGTPVTGTLSSTFKVPAVLSSGVVNSCWMPVNRGFEVGFADPHGHLCPGY